MVEFIFLGLVQIIFWFDLSTKYNKILEILEDVTIIEEWENEKY